MTTGRINQVTAFHCAHGAGSRGSSCANSNRAPCMKAQDGTCPARPKGTALVTALGLDFALLRTEQPFAIPSHAHILLCTVDQFEGTVPATAATNSSLGRLADPGLDRWHSTLLPMHTGDHWRNIPSAMSRTSPAHTRDMQRLIALPWDKHSQRQ